MKNVLVLSHYILRGDLLHSNNISLIIGGYIQITIWFCVWAGSYLHEAVKTFMILDEETEAK